MQWRVVITLLITVLCLIALGGFIFFMIEAGNETRLREESQQRTKVFLRDYPCVSESDYWYLVERVITEYSRGVLALRNKTISTNWDIMSSAYFATTVLTTIGYGHISPLTSAGRIFLVFYALLGIPLTMLLLIGLGGRLARLRASSRAGAYLQTAITLVVGFIVFLLLAAVMFWRIEGWSYTDSLYFGFITLSTLGFGDLVPGQSQQAASLGWYRLVVAGWILTSLIWLSMLFVMGSDAMKGGYQPKKKKDPPAPADTAPVVMVQADQLSTQLEQLEMADARRMSMAVPYGGDIRRKSIAMLSSPETDAALRDAVEDAMVARAYKERAAQVAKEMAVMDAASVNPALMSAMATAAMTSAAMAPDALSLTSAALTAAIMTSADNPTAAPRARVVEAILADTVAGALP